MQKNLIPPVVTRRLSERRRKGQKGGAIVEAALLFILFFAMLIGAFDFGQFLFVHQALVERARSAARWGAVNGGTNTTGVYNMVLYESPTVPDNPRPYFGLTSSMVTVNVTGANTDDYTLSVRIDNYPYRILSPYITGTYYGPGIVVSVPLGMFN